jgi:hypothetical protein
MLAKNFINEINSIKKKDTNSTITQTTKNYMLGATIGGSLGLVIGFVTKKNLLLSAFIGGVAGAGISKLIKNKFK